MAQIIWRVRRGTANPWRRGTEPHPVKTARGTIVPLRDEPLLLRLHGQESPLSNPNPFYPTTAFPTQKHNVITTFVLSLTTPVVATMS